MTMILEGDAVIAPTERLEQADARCVAFEARVVAHGTLGGAPSVVLDRSAFYPESGGQLADRGVLDGCAVRDVQIDDEGRVHHVLEGARPALGARVTGAVDVELRRLHAALHSAQHMLSRALLEVAGAETVSSRLGASVCTIDLDRDGIPSRRLDEAAAAVQALIDEDRPVRAWFPDADELASLPLRRAPKAEHARVRVVEVAGFDVSPCGGTHVGSTAQIGLVRLLGSERYKGGTRVSFSAGARARRELVGEAEALRELAATLGVPVVDARAAAEKLKGALEAARGELGRTRSALAASIVASATSNFVWVEEGGIELVRQVATLATRAGEGLVVVAGPVEGGVHAVVARGPDASLDARATWARLASVGGRGGGRPERAEGRFAADADALPALRASLAALAEG